MTIGRPRAVARRAAGRARSCAPRSFRSRCPDPTHSGLVDAGSRRRREPLREERLHVVDDVVVARAGLHRARLALHVHEADVGAGVGDDAGELGVAAQRRDVVDELRAQGERSAGDLGLRRVDRDRHLAGECLEHGDDTAQFLVEATPSAPGRVDSPPTSTIAAPSASWSRAVAAAVQGSKFTAPSENESGVTLTIPITLGRGKRSSAGGRTAAGYCRPNAKRAAMSEMADTPAAPADAGAPHVDRSARPARSASRFSGSSSPSGSTASTGSTRPSRR